MYKIGAHNIYRMNETLFTFIFSMSLIRDTGITILFLLNIEFLNSSDSKSNFDQHVHMEMKTLLK